MVLAIITICIPNNLSNKWKILIDALQPLLLDEDPKEMAD